MLLVSFFVFTFTSEIQFREVKPIYIPIMINKESVSDYRLFIADRIAHRDRKGKALLYFNVSLFIISLLMLIYTSFNRHYTD